MNAVITNHYSLTDRDQILVDATEHVLRVKDLPDNERPRERMAELGLKNLSTAELVAIIWVSAPQKKRFLA